MRQEPANPDSVIARIAGRQHGVVSSAQLRDAGIDGSAIYRRRKAGRLHRVHRGVYAVGHTRLSFEGRCQAAVLACGGGAVLSHRSAAVHWGLLPPAPGPIELTFPTDGGRERRPGITIHRSRTLTTQDVKRRLGVPVTSPPRTLRDLRRTQPAKLHRRAVRRALDLRLVSSEALGPDPDLTRSELERIFVRLCRRHRLPEPEVNVRIGPYEVDFLWRGLHLIVETDGFKYHASRAAFESDRARDAQLQALGFRVMRFTYRQLREAPEAVVGALRDVMRRGA